MAKLLAERRRIIIIIIIEKKNKEISCSGLLLPVEYLRNGKNIRVSFSLWPSARVTLPSGATHVSVVVIVSEIL